MDSQSLALNKVRVLKVRRHTPNYFLGATPQKWY